MAIKPPRFSPPVVLGGVAVLVVIGWIIEGWPNRRLDEVPSHRQANRLQGGPHQEEAASAVATLTRPMRSAAPVSDLRLIAASVGKPYVESSIEDRVQSARVGSHGISASYSGLIPTLDQAVEGKLSPPEWELRFRMAGNTAITTAEIKGITGFMESQPRNLTNDYYHAIGNDLIEAVVRAAPRTPNAFELLMRMARSESIDPVLADYVIQHFDQLREHYRDAVDREMLELARLAHGTVAGASCLVILRAYRQGTWSVGEAKTRDVIVNILTEESSGGFSHESKTAALAVCLHRQWTEVLPPARALAADSAAQMSARLAAIHLIATLGQSADRDHLSDLAASTREPLLRQAILLNL